MKHEHQGSQIKRFEESEQNNLFGRIFKLTLNLVLPTRNNGVKEQLYEWRDDVRPKYPFPKRGVNFIITRSSLLEEGTENHYIFCKVA